MACSGSRSPGLLGYWLICFSVLQDLYGVAEPATPGDNLDVTVGTTKEQATIQTSDSTKATIPGFVAAAAGGSAEGLSVGQKMFFIGGIAAVCTLFLRSRGTGQSPGKTRSMA